MLTTMQRQDLSDAYRELGRVCQSAAHLIAEHLSSDEIGRVAHEIAQIAQTIAADTTPGAATEER